MQCPYCDSIIRDNEQTCPCCGAQLSSGSDAQSTYSNTSYPEYPLPETEVPQTKRKKKSSMVSVVIFLIIGTVFLALGGYFMARSSSIKKSSTEVVSTLIESDRAYTDVSTKSKKSGKTRRTYYELKVYQHLVVEYTLNGDTKQADLGEHEVFETESRTSFSQSERDHYLRAYVYGIGDSIPVYVTDSGEVYLVSEIKSQATASKMFLLFGGILTAVGVFSVVKRKKQ